MRVYERLNKMNEFDEIDVKNAREAGFWTGAMAGVVCTFVLCLLIGYFVL